MSLPGCQIYIFLTLIFLYFYVPSGASYFYFLTSRKLYHMKFAIFDVARCRMSERYVIDVLVFFCFSAQTLTERSVMSPPLSWHGTMAFRHPSQNTRCHSCLDKTFHLCFKLSQAWRKLVKS